MADSDSLAREFEAHRAHLRGVAYRVLGSASDADDAVQDAWLRLSRTDVSDVVNLRAWLTTVTSRVALSMLESRGARREDVRAEFSEEAAAGPSGGVPAPLGPEDEALLGDEVSAALQVVLDTLEPRERLAFVLHDLFAVPFDDIAPVVDTSSTAARQLASRARRRLRDTSPAAVSASLTARAERQRAVVDAFFAAAREAQFATLLQILDPDVVMRADAVAARLGADESVSGADAVAKWINGRAAGAVPATVGGEPGAAWAVQGKVRVAFGFTVNGDGRITAINLVGDPDALTRLEIELAGQVLLASQRCLALLGRRRAVTWPVVLRRLPVPWLAGSWLAGSWLPVTRLTVLRRLAVLRGLAVTLRLAVTRLTVLRRLPVLLGLAVLRRLAVTGRLVALVPARLRLLRVGEEVA